MTGYDPQRNRTRAQPSTDGPAPVDMLLSGDTPEPPATREPELPPPIASETPEDASPPVVVTESKTEPESQDHAHDHAGHDHAGHDHGGHEHGPDCDHDHEGDPRIVMAAAAVSAGVVLYGLRRWLRRGRSAK